MKRQTPSDESIAFLKTKGYKYVGNGWFLPIEPVGTIGDFKRIRDFNVHERINLRDDMQWLCRKNAIHIMTYMLKRWKQNHIYGSFLIDNKV